MKRKHLLFALLFVATASSAFAYDFSAVAPSGQTLYYNIVGGNAEVTSQNTSSPRYSAYPTGNLVIPDSVTYSGTTYSVTSIGNYAFEYCSGLTSVTIPESVTSIGSNAFYDCHGLTSVTIGGSVTSIGGSAFESCIGLTQVIFSGTIEQWCNISFSNFSSNPLYYASNPLYYAHHLYIGGSEVTSLVIPNNVTEIKQYAFAGCSGLTSVTIPNSVTSIGDYAFRGCRGLTSVTIPESVTSIGLYAFSGCSSLTSVTIGGSVTSIGDTAFWGCSGLTAITFKNPMPPVIGENAFKGVPSNVAVTIPCGTLALYMSRLPSTWSNYTEATLGFEAQSADESMGTVQVLNQPTCTNPNAVVNAVPAAGYHFDHWSDGSTTNPYSLTVTGEMVLTAYFAADGGTEGIDDIAAGDIRIYASDGNIMVDGADGQPVRVFDMTGRQTGTRSLPAGVYMVQIGAYPARKVVVIR